MHVNFYGIVNFIQDILLLEIIERPSARLSDKVHHHQVQDDVGKDKVRESPFRRYPEELRFVLGVRLEAQAHWKTKACMSTKWDNPMSRCLPPRMKQLMVEMNPDRNELKGKVPTRQQYKNWKIPVSRM